VGFRMSCDRCGRFMQEIKGESLKKYDNKEIVCPACEKVEGKIVGEVERMRLVAQKDVNKLVDQYRQMMIEIIQRHVENGDS